MSEPILGGIGLTHLSVYQAQEGPDGVHAGCAHIHALTPEAYFGVSGEGAIELHDLENGFRRLPINKGTFVQFEPATLHRSISIDHLEVLAIMGNGGLAERGDARIYFGEAVDEIPGEYERLRGLVSSGYDGAMQRRDASAKAYAMLMHLWADDRSAYFAELQRFIGVHENAIVNKKAEFKPVIENGPVRVGETALAALAALGNSSVSKRASAATANVNDVGVVLGMCGELRQVERLTPL